MRLSSPKMNVMHKACMKASKSLIRDFGEVEKLQVSSKGPGDFVSAADRKAEKIIIEELLKANSSYGVLSEEAGEINKNNKNNRWIIDPIDGTLNFLNGIPQFAISVGYEENGEIVSGIIFDPIKDEMFFAEKGNGAFLNNSRIRVSKKQKLKNSLLVTGGPKFDNKNKKAILEEYNDISGCVEASIRKFGSAALDMANVACGRFDGYWQWDLHYWDIAAGLIILKEAGGFVSFAESYEEKSIKRNVIATNSNIHQELIDSLSKKLLSKINI
ncbi:MAG: inositol monophosphatase [Candidatus Pelagibacter sp.]|nr:inositol monophosphatase [Candidatus Pelagibacter sp.]RPG11191.1 MAG: inositol monophosphatase [Pelagibacteraceae bacterium TMED170]|tara:strand:- start:375 stop:1190 length:816 start_codon:yes stop_codon:yes gene_type:complete